MKEKYTVVWGNIGSDSGCRLDHVEAEPDFESIMDAAFRIAYNEIEGIEDEMTFEEFCNQSYDGYAIFEGHIFEGSIHFG